MDSHTDIGMFPYEDANPCNICGGITLAALISEDGYAHHRRYLDLLDSVQKGCVLCSLINKALLLSKSNLSMTSHQASERLDSTNLLEVNTGSIKLQWQQKQRSRDHARSFFDVFLPRPDILISDMLSITIAVGENQNRATWPQVGYAELGFYTDPDTEAAKLIPGRRLPTSLNSEANKSRIEFWIKERIASADQAENTPPRLPKRVIDIKNCENERTVRLLETGINVSGRYICLSHCWGGNLHYRTTNETIEERMRSINIDDLPLNFQDVIDLTRRLGVWYIWIDALCIIQDSKDDWEAEAAKMGVYYNNSWLTIAAGMYKDGSRGLFTERHIPEQPMCRLQLAGTEVAEASNLYFSLDPLQPPPQEMDLSNTCDTLAMHKLRPSSNEQLVKTMSPIRSRAWALQEELLPDRYVIFEPSQVYFRCNGFVDFESGRREVLDASSAFAGGKLCFKSADWQTLVRRYSARNLTQEMDKLPALSGLAHGYRDTWGGDYLAGLWRKDLWQGLLWKRRALISFCDFRRPKTYRAPSWSWASTEGEIEFSNTLTTNHECRVDILHASTQLAGIDPMGQVSGGKIVLRGIFMDSNEIITQSHHTTGMVSLSLSRLLNFKYDIEIPEHHQKWLIWITTYSGLILSRVSGQSRTYERIGHFETRLGFSSDEFWEFPRVNEIISII